MPSLSKTHEFIDDIFSFLFPVIKGTEMDQLEGEVELSKLQGKMTELLLPMRDHFKLDIKQVCCAFFEDLPEIYIRLIDDAKAILEGDPAAYSIEEIVLGYPGFFAIVVHRIANQLYKQEVPLIPRLFSEYAHSKTGIDIHPGATIGDYFCIDHGTGVVIGETTVIGNNVKVYQGVTLGALSVEKKFAKSKRHPTIEDNVVIYAGSTILGGKTIVGHDTIIGGNVWLTDSVEPYSIVYHKSEVKVRKNETSQF
ncbi:serine O-acetyltransferase [Sediminitomix flava]|uniref:Serine O-acetyltransferase n=2 Tax=Sediminitomix flava TaxID=379075 RepID=A0A315ZEK3_SEDFL|nr:serine O-acetyltransferase [Sediminitomix flava]